MFNELVTCGLSATKKIFFAALNVRYDPPDVFGPQKYRIDPFFW